MNYPSFTKETFVTNTDLDSLHIYMQAIINTKRTDLFITPDAYYSNGEIYKEAIALHHIPNGKHVDNLEDFWNEVERLRAV